MQAVVDLYQGISRRAEFAGASGRELAVFGADGCGPDAHGGSHGKVRQRVLETAKRRFLFRVMPPAREFLLKERDGHEVRGAVLRVSPQRSSGYVRLQRRGAPAVRRAKKVTNG